MNTSETHILYGQPPRGLVDMHADALQCSPLFPGSMRLADCAAGSAASAIIYAPAGTIERRYVFARTFTALAVGATLTALAPKDKGGRRIAAELKAFGCDVSDSSRAHHRIITTTRPGTLHGIDEALAEGGLRHYPHGLPTSSNPTLAKKREAMDTEKKNVHAVHDFFEEAPSQAGLKLKRINDGGLWTQPGVFSWDRIDAGSALLLKYLPALHGHGADFGCGIGILSRAVLASADVRALTLFDIDRRAIAAAKHNITDPRARFQWADIRSATLPFDLDFVVMNPPFHDHGIEDQTLGQQFIARAAASLKKGGQCWLTANRHLPYEALLATLFTRVTLVDEADGFKIFMAEK